jgi:ABC-type uncharacterized transport system permease subunit
MIEPTAGQIALLVASVALFAAGWALSLARLWADRGPLRLAAKACMYGGLVTGLGVLLWHSADRGNWLPLSDNFDTLVWLGLLLALFVLYTQRTRPLRGLDWFVTPIVVLLLVSAAVFGRTKPHGYDVRSLWLWTHRVTAYGGAIAFAVAGAAGAMYLIVNHRLRAKSQAPGAGFASLERLEHFTLASVTLGFSLLTIGTVTGIVRFVEEGGHTPMPTSVLTKVVLALAVWVVYAVVLHSPMNPSFRGRKAAVLSVVGFVLMVGTIVAVQFVK